MKRSSIMFALLIATLALLAGCEQTPQAARPTPPQAVQSTSPAATAWPTLPPVTATTTPRPAALAYAGYGSFDTEVRDIAIKDGDHTLVVTVWYPTLKEARYRAWPLSIGRFLTGLKWDESGLWDCSPPSGLVWVRSHELEPA
jgi:hypothetical protein